MFFKIGFLVVLVCFFGCHSSENTGLCKKDKDCKEGVCVFGKCQECASSTDCQNGKTCDNNQCVAEKDAPIVSVPSAQVSACTATGVVHFDFNTYDFKSEDRDLLAEIATCMRAEPESKFSISGHTDERGTVEYNLVLGEKRAQSVAQYLQNSGIDGSRMNVISYGKEKPTDTGHNEEAWAKNRRTEINAD